jgi:lipopolysaccharide transport system permease protein
MADYLRRVWASRHFWLMLVRMDIQTRYQRSVLGVGWSFMQPALLTVIVCAVFSGGLGLDPGEYAPFLFVGLTFWSFVGFAVQHGCHCFVRGAIYIRQQNVPMAVYALRTALVAAVHLVLALALAVPLIALWRGEPPGAALLILPFTCLLLTVLGWSVAVLVGVAHAYFPDVEPLSGPVLQVAFYATPVIYPPEMLRDRGLGWLCDLNPLAACLELIRQPLLAGQWPSTEAAALVALTAAALAGCAALVLARAESRLVFRL